LSIYQKIELLALTLNGTFWTYALFRHTEEVDGGYHFMSLKLRILFVSGLLIAFALVTNVLSIKSLYSQNKVNAEIGEVWLPAVGKAADININVANHRKLEFNLLATQSTDEQKALIEEMDSLMGNITIYSKVLEPLLTTPELQTAFADFQTAWDSYIADSEKFRAAVDQENPKLAEEILQGDSEKHFKICYEKLKDLTDKSYMAGIAMSEKVSASFKLTFYFLLGLVFLSVVIGLGMSFWNIRVMQKSLQSVADGLDTSSEVVRNRATELVGTSEAISLSSTSTAASLEEIVATMEELTATVRQNSLNSTQASNLSKEGLVTVNDGQRQLENLIRVIGEISQSSRKIEEILGLIDDIAFQTNLLALNAAVEAARAGEQGRGFAVVADAVRALALKSAQAGKDINGLIKDSSEKTKNGVHLAAESEKALKNIVSNTSRVSELIQQVAEGSSEQSQGIEQVNKALTHIDQSLQGVASSMSSVTNSSEDMQSQSEKLSEMMQSLYILVGKKNQLQNKQNQEIPPEEDSSAA
jgi:methyl-accepting chemotaxis protein